MPDPGIGHPTVDFVRREIHVRITADGDAVDVQRCQAIRKCDGDVYPLVACQGWGIDGLLVPVVGGAGGELQLSRTVIGAQKHPVAADVAEVEDSRPGLRAVEVDPGGDCEIGQVGNRAGRKTERRMARYAVTPSSDTAGGTGGLPTSARPARQPLVGKPPVPPAGP